MARHCGPGGSISRVAPWLTSSGQGNPVMDGDGKSSRRETPFFSSSKNRKNHWVVVVSNVVYFHPYLGKGSNLTIIFFKWVETTN